MKRARDGKSCGTYDCQCFLRKFLGRGQSSPRGVHDYQNPATQLFRIINRTLSKYLLETVALSKEFYERSDMVRWCRDRPVESFEKKTFKHGTQRNP